VRQAVRRPRIRAKDGGTLTVDQARQLLEAAAGYRFEAAFVLALARTTK
jgi:hypothetical protein